MANKDSTSKHERRVVKDGKQADKISNKNSVTGHFVGDKLGRAGMTASKHRPKTGIHVGESEQAEAKARANLMLEFLDELASSPMPPRTAEEIEADIHAERNAWNE